MAPEKGRKYAIGYLGEFEHDGWSGVAEYTGFYDGFDGGELLFEFFVNLPGQERALFPESSILAEVK